MINRNSPQTPSPPPGLVCLWLNRNNNLSGFDFGVEEIGNFLRLNNEPNLVMCAVKKYPTATVFKRQR